MCLYVDSTATDNFKRNNRAKKVKIYKVVIFDGLSPHIKTPFMGKKVEAGSLEALGQLKYREYCGRLSLSVGVIHCFISKAAARQWVRRFCTITDMSCKSIHILTCWAYAKDFVAKGDREEIAFKKIFVPASEIKRVRKTQT